MLPGSANRFKGEDLADLFLCEDGRERQDMTELNDNAEEAGAGSGAAAEQAQDQSFSPARGVAWSGRPSMRPYILGAAIMAGVAYLISFYVGPAFQVVINATQDVIPWTASIIEKVYYAAQTVIWFPLVAVLFKMLRVFFTSYRIEDGRLIYDHGLIFRKQDQIALQRVRDFRVLKPVSQRIAGTGTVMLVSRDETYPELPMGPFSSPVEVSEIIRGAVLAQQKATNYREFEST